MLKIYGVPVSVHTRKVIVTAILKGIDYENEPVIPFNPPRNWRSLSPTGLIPAISHDGFDLSDSNAICAYLERLWPSPPIYPTEARAFGHALWLEQYATAVLFRQVFHPIFYQKVIRPYILKQGETDAAEIERVVEGVAPDIFGYLDGQASKTFFGGNRLRISDISIASNLINYHYMGLRLDAGQFPRLAKAFAHTIGQAAFQRALEREAPFADNMGLDRSFLN